MFAEGAGFLEHADLDIAEISAGLVIGFDQPGECDRSSHSRRSAPDEENIHRHRLGVGRLRQDQPFHGERRLMRARENISGAGGHQWCFFASRTASVSAGITSNTSPTIP